MAACLTLMDQRGVLQACAQEHPGQMEDLGHHFLPGARWGWIKAVICLAGTRQENGQGETSGTYGWSKGPSWPLRPSEDSLCLFLFEQTAAKEPSPQGPCMGPNKPNVPT